METIDRAQYYDRFEEDKTMKLIQDSIIDQGRWSTLHERIYEDLTEHKFYRVLISYGSTECQEDDSDIDYEEVEPYEKTIVAYRKVS